MALVHGKMLLMKLSFFLLAAATILLAAAADKPLPPPQAKPNCRHRCGNLIIPYPFGIGDGCYMPLKGFNLSCDDSTRSPSLNLSRTLRVTDFNITEGELQISNFISKDCYDKSGLNLQNTIPTLRLGPPFSISGPKNRFVAIGCDTFAVFKGFRGEEPFMTGCLSVCLNINTVDETSCSGVGCCQTTIPEGLTNRTLTLGSFSNHTNIWEFNPCSYAFLVQDGYFNFSGTKSFKELKNRKKMPTIVNWQIGNEPCEVAKKNAEDYACKGNSTCANRTKSPYPGYYCQCLPGYEGNPYLGCQDINECLAEIKRCGNGTCQNTPGNYTCKCNEGFENDGQWKCIARPKGNNTPLKISLGICIGFCILLVIIFGLYREYKRIQFYRLKTKYFEANGGPKIEAHFEQLMKQLASQKEPSQKEPLVPQIFTTEQLKMATKDYDEKQKIGEGGYGEVYKGVLDDKRVVAIKKSKTTAQVERDQFVTEIIVLSDISHENVVRLVGCCVDTKTPVLVYEFVDNGTLYDHIHKKEEKELQPLSFAQRLKIATQTATALSYLHNSKQIVHRDVKLTNILLDKNLMAKVSDFGASKLVPDNKAQLPTLVQGTMGYLDPEYLQSRKLTKKSDVYSFGVVLVELLTSQNAIRFDTDQEKRILAKVFVSTIENTGQLNQILDGEIVKDGNWEMIEKVAKLAERCLRVKKVERPTMEEVERELNEILKTSKKQQGGKKLYASSSKETDPSRESHSNTSTLEISDEGDDGSTGIATSAEYYASMQYQAQKPSGYGR